MSWIEQKITKLDKLVNYLYCKVKNLTNTHNELDGLPTEIQNENIDVVVFKSPNGTLKQRYYDDSNTLVINNL